MKASFALKSCFDTFPVGFGRVRNSDNRANSAQLQTKLTTKAELGKIMVTEKYKT